MERLKKLLYRIPEAAELAGCGRSKGYEMAASGVWETIDTGYGRRVVAESLERWIEEKRQAGK